MKPQVTYFNFERKSELSWSKGFFICAGLTWLYYIAYLVLLLHIIVKSGSHIF